MVESIYRESPSSPDCRRRSRLGYKVPTDSQKRCTRGKQGAKYEWQGFGYKERGSRERGILPIPTDSFDVYGQFRNAVLPP